MSNQRDHPRGCGEHSLYTAPIPRREGSSPRMRGARDRSTREQNKTRIIPADAGSTTYIAIFLFSLRDHPRGCGEHCLPGRSRTWTKGSSPRMRGAHICISLLGWQYRIIPADAGSTSPSQRPRSRRWDHPRGCGEHGRKVWAGFIDWGSSPRMRGALVKILGTVVFARIIPADAGSTMR